jgi:hypothetical protein
MMNSIMRREQERTTTSSDDHDARVDNDQEIDGGDCYNHLGSILHSSDRLLGRTLAARTNGTRTDAKARSPRVLAKNRPSSAVPGAYAMDGATPLRRSTTGALTPMPSTECSSVLPMGNEAMQRMNKGASEFQELELKRWKIQGSARFVLLLLICVGVGIGVGMWMRGRKDTESSATAPTTATIPLELERMLHHCSTPDGDALLMDEHLVSLSDQDRIMYSKYAEAFPEADLPTMYSCRADNLALMYLTMDEGNMDQLQSSAFELRNAAITKYSLAVLFISWSGLTWLHNDRWLTSDPVC